MPDCKPAAGVVARPETARETALKTPKSSAGERGTAGGGDGQPPRARRGLDVSRLEDLGDAVRARPDAGERVIAVGVGRGGRDDLARAVQEVDGPAGEARVAARGPVIVEVVEDLAAHRRELEIAEVQAGGALALDAVTCRWPAPSSGCSRSGALPRPCTYLARRRPACNCHSRRSGRWRPQCAHCSERRSSSLEARIAGGIRPAAGEVFEHLAADRQALELAEVLSRDIRAAGRRDGDRRVRRDPARC